MAVVRRAGSRYQVDFFLFGHRVRTHFYLEQEAEAFRDRLIASLPVKVVSIERAVREYLKNESEKRKTKQSRQMEGLWFYELKRFLSTELSLGLATPVSEVTLFHLEKFQTHLMKNGSDNGVPLKASSVNRRFHSIKNFFRKMEDWGFRRGNPSKGVRKLPEKLNPRRRWRPFEVQVVLRSTFIAKGDRDLFRFLLLTGVRLGSALDLKEKEIDLDERIAVIRQRKGRGEENAYAIPLSPETLELLRSRLTGRPNSHIFRAECGRNYNSGMISIRFRRARRILGLDHLTLHGLRHTFATELSERGASTETIRRLLGHANSKTTEGYLHADFDHLRRWLK